MKRKLFLSNFSMFLIVLLLPIIILGTSIIFISSAHMTDTIQMRNEILIQNGIEEHKRMFQQIASLNLTLDARSTIVRALENAMSRSDGTMSGDDYELADMISQMLMAVASSSDVIYSIYFYVPNESMRFIDSNNGITDIERSNDLQWYTSYANTSKSISNWYEKREIRRYEFEDPLQLFTFYHRMSSKGPSDGILAVNLYAEKIDEILNRVAKAAEIDFIIIDDKGEMLFSNQDMKLKDKIDWSSVDNNSNSEYSYQSSEKEYIIKKEASFTSPAWTYISITDSDLYSQLSDTIKTLLLISIMACLMVGIFLSYRMTKKNISLFESILHIIDESNLSHPLPEIKLYRSDVYGYILANVVRTYASHQSLQSQLIEKNYRIKSLELSALRSQIRPHFLYNTLETIKWMAIGLTNGMNPASEMIQDLSGILRYSFTHTISTVNIATEIEIMNKYFRIQKIRYKQLENVIWNVDERLLDKKVLKFMLQPIVENCFQHGLGSEECRISIKITILSRNNKLIIRITDTGIGMTKDRLKYVSDSLSMDTFEEGNSIGLANTNQRIKMYYGSQYGIRIQSQKNIGTVVTLTLCIDSKLDQELL